MKIKDLIKELEKYPDDFDVFVCTGSDYGKSFSLVKQVKDYPSTGFMVFDDAVEISPSEW